MVGLPERKEGDTSYCSDVDSFRGHGDRHRRMRWAGALAESRPDALAERRAGDGELRYPREDRLLESRGDGRADRRRTAAIIAAAAGDPATAGDLNAQVSAGTAALAFDALRVPGVSLDAFTRAAEPRIAPLGTIERSSRTVSGRIVID